MKRITIILASVGVTGAIARAQPLPDVTIPPDGGSGSGSGSGSDGSGGSEEPLQPITVQPTGPADPYPSQPPKPAKPLPPVYMPEVLTTPTGWLLPAAVIYSKTSVDTGGGLSSDWRVGLGDVAEFGIGTTDQIRERDGDSDIRSERIQPYLMASFRLGVAEDRIFEGQPGMTLGFRKSFERHHNDYTTRVAELTLVASKHVGKYVAFHAGGAFWDASMEGDLDDDGMTVKREVTLHDLDDPMGRSSLHRQVRPFGGLEVRPLPRSQILLDLGWAPEFCYQCSGPKTAGANPDANKIVLKPVLSWGVRYEVARWLRLESGVRVPDIAEANLLDAQIFGQLSFTSWALRRGVDSLK